MAVKGVRRAPVTAQISGKDDIGLTRPGRAQTGWPTGLPHPGRPGRWWGRGSPATSMRSDQTAEPLRGDGDAAVEPGQGIEDHREPDDPSVPDASPTGKRHVLRMHRLRQPTHSPQSVLERPGKEVPVGSVSGRRSTAQADAGGRSRAGGHRWPAGRVPAFVGAHVSRDTPPLRAA